MHTCRLLGRGLRRGLDLGTNELERGSHLVPPLH